MKIANYTIKEVYAECGYWWTVALILLWAITGDLWEGK